MLLEVDLL